MKQRKPNRLNGYDYSQDNLYFVTSCVHDMVCCFGDVAVRTGRDLSSDAVQNLSSKVGDEPPSAINDNIAIGNIETGHTVTNDIEKHNSGTGRNLFLQEPQMILNKYGKITEQQWHWLAEQYPYVILHEFIVMPNHIHGIIEIDRNAVGTGRDLSGNGRGLSENGRGLSENAKDNHTETDHTETARTRTGRTGIGRTGTGRDLSLRKIKSLSELMGAYKMSVSKLIHLEGYPEFTWQRSFYDHIIRDQRSYENISNYIIDNPKTWDNDKFYNLQKIRNSSENPSELKNE